MEEKARKTYFDFDEYIRQMRDTLIRHVGPKKGGHWEIVAD